MLYICVKFYKNICNSFQLTELTRVYGRDGYFQYLLYSKSGNSKSRLHCVLHILSWCFTFVKNFMKISQTVFNLQSRHKYMVEMAMFNVQRAVSPKVGKNRVRVHKFCLSSHQALNLWKVSLEYLK